MAASMVEFTFDERDKRLIAALQCDGRLPAERAAAVLGLPTRVVQRRWAELLATGAVRVVASPPRPSIDGVMLVRIRVLRGKVDTLSQVLARRSDIPFLDVSTSGDQLIAVVTPRVDGSDRLLLEELPTSPAILSVDAQTVIHVFSDAADWTADYLSQHERQALTPPVGGEHPTGDGVDLDPLDTSIVGALTHDGRRSAAMVARLIGEPESTVRRRMTTLLDRRLLVTQVVVDPKALGFLVDADLCMQVAPERLDAAGRALAEHPAVHGALATTGPANLTVAVWLPNLEHLYQFITRDLAHLGVNNVDTVLIGRTVKRPAGMW
jgi:DNA-binding Lrp family transcriptional regulator